MFSLVTEKKIEFGWQVFVSPRSTKTLEALVKPKVTYKNFDFIAFAIPQTNFPKIYFIPYSQL